MRESLRSHASTTTAGLIAVPEIVVPLGETSGAIAAAGGSGGP